MEPPPASPLARSRASTLQGGSRQDVTDSSDTKSSRDNASTIHHGDIFEEDSVGATNDSTATPASIDETKHLPKGFDDLPIELVSLTDRY